MWLWCLLSRLGPPRWLPWRMKGVQTWSLRPHRILPDFGHLHSTILFRRVLSMRNSIHGHRHALNHSHNSFDLDPLGCSRTTTAPSTPCTTASLHRRHFRKLYRYRMSQTRDDSQEVLSDDDRGMVLPGQLPSVCSTGRTRSFAQSRPPPRARGLQKGHFLSTFSK